MLPSSLNRKSSKIVKTSAEVTELDNMRTTSAKPCWQSSRIWRNIMAHSLGENKRPGFSARLKY
jgi:hypothetical protein